MKRNILGRQVSSSRFNRCDCSSAVNVLPLIDVLFLLLAFFVVLTTSMVMRSGINLELAQAESGSRQSDITQKIVINIDETGKFFLNKKEIAQGQLFSLLAKANDKVNSSEVYIDADKNAKHEWVTFALDTARKSGLNSVTIGVTPK